MKSAQALQVFLTIFLSVIAQCTISTAQAVVTQTGGIHFRRDTLLPQ